MPLAQPACFRSCSSIPGNAATGGTVPAGDDVQRLHGSGAAWYADAEKKVIGYGLVGVGVLLIAPMWCAMGEGSIYDSAALVSMPAWVVAMVGLGLVGLGNFVLGPSLQERKAKRQADEAAFQERMARHRAVVRSPEYQALDQRAKELSEAANQAEDAGEIDRRDALREEWHATVRARNALRDEDEE